MAAKQKTKTDVFKKKDFDAKAYVPHEFKTEIISKFDDIMIKIPMDILADMVSIAGLVKEEVSWLGTVVRDGLEFLITEVFVPEQAVSSGETEMTGGGVAEIATQLMETDKGEVERVNQLRFWCHTHPFGGTAPSSPDVEQTKKLLENVDDFFIRGISNKKGKIQFTVWLIQEGVTIIDCPWRLELDDMDISVNYWHEHINKKVSKKTHTRGAWLGQGGGTHPGRGYQSNLYEPKKPGQIWCQIDQGWVWPQDKQIWSPIDKAFMTVAEIMKMTDIEKKKPANARAWNQANMIVVRAQKTVVIP